MAQIYSLKPNLTLTEAIEQFNSKKLSTAMRRIRFGPLRSVADVYVPFRVFQVDIKNGERRERQVLGLDAVRGSLDMYGFDHVPDESELILVETRNIPEPLLDENRASQIIAERVRRQIFTTGFFRVSTLTITASALPIDLHVPYWIGLFGSGEKASLMVMDAVRKRFEGAKARELMAGWLAR